MRTARLGLPLLAAGLLATSLHAAPTFQFQISGTLNVPAGTSVTLNPDFEGAFGNQYASGGSSGGLVVSGDNSPVSPFSQTRVEIFSDPDITSSPILYADVRTFSYFGLLTNYDAGGSSLSRQFFVAADPGTASAMNLSTLLSPFLSQPANAGVTIADFVQAVADGADRQNGAPLPVGQTNELFLRIRDFFEGGGAGGEFFGNIGTTFQTADVQDLVAYDLSSPYAPSLRGTMVVNAELIPEPGTLTLLLPGALLLGRRRNTRSHS
jgi:hypothetical protein